MATRIRLQSGWTYEVEESVEAVNAALREAEYAKFEESPGEGRSTIEVRSVDVASVEEIK